ncbi:nucleotidyltransferase family protein [Limibaculum sp. M0105]|uniref:Nucleotidyltransferase family protein n=1 Tax=Thermohalobaculum xanthum TaxID=2753746 RepID=A0A8J7M9P3_9RHOB|nr:nucleotidyltransferase family protein [Thermohalobaculum xanthum]MBK0400293.1 nucleotidyltransferase family protein [Thermohalobaculum xanthum]
MSWTALILAGSRGAADPVAQAAGVSHKAFAELEGRTMLARVATALSAVPQVGRILVSIEPGAPALPAGLERLDAAPSPARSVGAALATAAPPVLVTTADHPLLTPDMVADFIRGAEAAGADICAGVATRPVVEAAGNPARRTYLRFRDAEVSGCNLFALRTPRAEAAVRFWQRLETERKKPWRMALAIGPLTLASYAAGLLTMAGAAGAIGRAAGCSAALVTLDHPDAAHDVDKPADLVFAETRLRARKAG